MGSVETDELAFVSFYNRYGISPVSQDISDLESHFRRRGFLYSQLGLAPALIAGRSVLEFGPGSGHNSLYTASCNPARYVLVDANERAIADLHESLAPYLTTAGIEIVTSLFWDFVDDGRFDIVLAEACIPHQIDPVGVLSTVARHVLPGGVLVITCISGVSYLSETLRRLIRDRLIPADAPPDRQLDLLRPVFGPHLEHLHGRSRPVDDWILDNIVQPFPGSLMSIEDAVGAVAGEFEFVASSPRFLTDLRWYKDAQESFAPFLIEQSHSHALNFMDYRLDLPAGDPAIGRELDGAGKGLWDAMQVIEAGGPDSDSAWDVVVDLVEEVASTVQDDSPETARAVREVGWALQVGSGDQPMPAFSRLWGRGQQYLSFARRRNPMVPPVRGDLR